MFLPQPPVIRVAFAQGLVVLGVTVPAVGVAVLLDGDVVAADREDERRVVEQIPLRRVTPVSRGIELRGNTRPDGTQDYVDHPSVATAVRRPVPVRRVLCAVVLACDYGVPERADRVLADVGVFLEYPLG